MAKTIKVALAGAGAFGLKHLDGIKNIDGVEVVSLVGRRLDPTKEVAAKYKSRKDAEAYLVKKIKEGSTGVWGPVPMPPNGTVADDEARTLAKYILTVK